MLCAAATTAGHRVRLAAGIYRDESLSHRNLSSSCYSGSDRLPGPPGPAIRILRLSSTVRYMISESYVNDSDLAAVKVHLLIS